MATPQRIYIDCTVTYYTGLNTCIQRVVNNVISRSANLSQKYGIEIIPVVAVSGTFKKLYDVIEESKQPSLRRTVLQRWSALKQRISKFFQVASDNPSQLAAFIARMLHAGLHLTYILLCSMFQIVNFVQSLSTR